MTDAIETSQSEHRGWTIRTYSQTWTTKRWGSDEEVERTSTWATVQRPGPKPQKVNKNANGARNQDVATLTKKARKAIDVILLDDEQRRDITRKMASMDKSHKTPRNHDSRLDVLLRTTAAIGLEPPQVGDRAWVWGQGRWRAGMLTKINKSTAEVAYTTPSSSGRIYRPVRHHDDIWMGS